MDILGPAVGCVEDEKRKGVRETIVRRNNCATHLAKGIAEDYCYQVEMSIIF